MFLSQYNKPGLLARCALLVLLLCSLFAHALEDDRSKPIHVKADTAERDDKRGITTYRGDVVIDQGSLNIAAQEVIMYGSTSIERIVATGRPARPSPN